MTTISQESAQPTSLTAPQLDDLFDRVNSLLGSGGEPTASAPASSAAKPAPAAAFTTDSGKAKKQAFVPKQPGSLAELGVPESQIEKIALKYLFQIGTATARGVASQLQVPFPIIEPMLRQMRSDQFIALKGTTHAGDSEYTMTDVGRDRARRYIDEGTYFGAVPVPLDQYRVSVAAQTMADQTATAKDLKEAFSDLIINLNMLNKLGPAVNSGRGMFLFGEPGNGKTSIAERVTTCFGSSIWIPRALYVEGEIVRLFDPGVHKELKDDLSSRSIMDDSNVDKRWVQIERPTVIAGGELTMAELEVTQNPQSKICESPLQLKSNCGTLVIDDFGRQRMPVDELLNRWIVPLEKRYDFLNLPSGKKVDVPFDQLIIFSTNLEPKDLVDGAFLRRIPYKIEVIDPTESEFRQLCELMCRVLKFEYNAEAVDYLIKEHYLKAGRSFKACQPRDLLFQVRNFCVYHGQEVKLTQEAFDFAVENYFSVL